MLTVNEQHGRYEKERASIVNEIEDYAKNFSEVADLVDLHTKDNNDMPAMMIFINAIKEKAKANLVKVQLKEGLNKRMEKIAQKRARDEGISLPKSKVDKLQSLF